MNKKINIAVITLASALFTGVLVNGSPISVNADDDFIVDLHYESFLKVEAGHDFTVVLSTNNEVFTFGRNDRGQLGNGNTDPTLSVFNITESFNLYADETVVDIDAGYDSAVALTSTNRIFTWGDNTSGKLGDGTTTQQSLPIDVTNSFNPNTPVEVKKIVAGDGNTMVWLTGNVVRMAGRNGSGQLGQGNITSTPSPVSVNFSSLLNGDTIKDVGIFASTAYTLSETGLVLAWGMNADKQVGTGDVTSSVRLPSQLSFPGLSVDEKVVSVSIGVNHGVAVTSDSKVFFWGTNSNSAVGDTTTLPKGTVKNTPFNATEAFIYEDEETGYLDGFARNFNDDYSDPSIIYYEEFYRPLNVYAGNDATFFDVEYGYRDYINNVPEDYIYYTYFWVIGLNTFEDQNSIISADSDTELIQTEFADFNYYNDGDVVIEFGLSRTNSIFLNSENDFTIFGSNLYGQHGVGYTSEGGSEYNTNYSYEVRDFMDYIYSELPTNLTAPLDSYFDPAGGPSSDVVDEERAIFGYWYGFNENVRGPGIVDYLFPEAYFGDMFSEKEWSVITAEEMTFMRQIIATVFEDEIVYESYIRTDELILEELESGREAADWLREDFEYYSSYGSYELAWDDPLYLDDAIIDLLPASVETRISRYRELLAAIEGFEDTYLQPFLALLEEETNDVTVDIDFVYFDEYFNQNALDLGNEQIEYLLDNEYETMILSIFSAYEALPELVQLLINEWNFYGIYEELYYAYYEFFADDYSDVLSQFEDDIQEGDWSWYWPLFENLTALEALLEGRDALNPISYDMFADFYVDGDDNIYDYYYYEYWIWLNDLLPALQEGKDVFDLIVLVEAFIQYDEYSYVELENVPAILEMYEAFLLLSEEAQNLLDPEYVNWIYGLALEALVYEVDLMLFDLSNTEDEGYALVLFENYNDVLAAIAKYEALPEDALDLLDLEAIEYYEYLLGLQPYLEEGFDVYEAIKAIDEMDLEAMDDATIEAISDMYNDYLNLSEEAKSLLDPEHVETLRDLAIQAVESYIAELPLTVEDFDELFNDEETKDATINSLLNAWNAYQAMSDELKDGMDEVQRAHLEALYNRYLESSETQLDLSILALIIVHLSVGAYFAFKKRDVLIKIND